MVSTRSVTRTLCGLATLLLGATLATACGGDDGAKGAGTIQLLVFGDPEELAAFRTLTTAYQAARPGAAVQLIEASDADDLITRLSTSISGGAPPDVFLMNYRSYGQFAGKDAIEPLDERLGERSERCHLSHGRYPIAHAQLDRPEATA